jgi:Mrp family chromosome partitioning ATPase/DUF971 family protein
MNNTFRNDAILEKLSRIIDPDLGADIVSLGFVKKIVISEEQMVSFNIELTTPACPVKDEFKRQAVEAVTELAWVKKVDVTMTSVPRKNPENALKGLSKVKNIVAVSSCKGGVGKSTVALNLAYTLALSGANVGLFDADIYGPSVPTMAMGDIEPLTMDKNFIKPIEHRGVKLMSFGFTQDETAQDQPAILRGPMVTQIINQLLFGTDWGELDYLILDMPPGTGDIQITLGQGIPMAAAVIVTTPQHISFIDVVKGVQMFDSLKVPTLAVVENMNHFMCGSCDKKHFLFGTGAGRRLVEEFGFNNAVSLPIDPELAKSCDTGTPFVMQHPNSDLAKSFKQLSDQLVRDISKMQYGKSKMPDVIYPKEDKVAFEESGQPDILIQPSELRKSCRCANCVDEMTNKPIHKGATFEEVYPVGINRVGNYAIGINWSDGHSSLFPYEQLKQFNLGVTAAA